MYYLQNEYNFKVAGMSNLLIKPDGVYKLNLNDSLDLWERLTGKNKLCRYCKHGFFSHNVKYIIQHFWSKGELYKVNNSPTFFSKACFDCKNKQRDFTVCFTESNGLGEDLSNVKIRVKRKTKK